MPCPPLMCSGAHDCGDKHCEGHPVNTGLIQHEGGTTVSTPEPASYQTVFADLERIEKRTALWCLAVLALITVLVLSSDALASHWPRLVAWVSF